MFLLLWVVIAFAILRRVDDRPREWTADDLPLLADAAAARVEPTPSGR